MSRLHSPHLTTHQAIFFNNLFERLSVLQFIQISSNYQLFLSNSHCLLIRAFIPASSLVQLLSRFCLSFNQSNFPTPLPSYSIESIQFSQLKKKVPKTRVFKLIFYTHRSENLRFLGNFSMLKL